MLKFILNFFNQNLIVFISLFMLFFFIIKKNKYIRRISYGLFFLGFIYLILVILYKNGIGYEPLYTWSITVIYEILELVQKIFNIIYLQIYYLTKIFMLLFGFGIDVILYNFIYYREVIDAEIIYVPLFSDVKLTVKEITVNFKYTIKNLIKPINVSFVYRC